MARHTSRARRNPTSHDFESVSAVVGEKIKHHIQHLRRVAEDSRREADEAHDAWVGGRWDELVSMGVITSRDLHSLEAEEAKLIDLRPYSRNPRGQMGHRSPASGVRRDAAGRFVRARR